MEFNKNNLINSVLNNYYETFAQTLDTSDFVPEKFNKKIYKYIFKNMQKKFKEIEIYNLLYLSDIGYKLSVFDKLKIYLSGLRPIYNNSRKKAKKKDYNPRKP